MNLKIYLTKHQYLKYNMSYAGSIINTFMHNSYYLLGLYYNNSFINLNISLYRIKSAFRILNAFLKVNCFNYFIINLIDNINIMKYYKKVMNVYKVSYSFGKWKNGFLNNFHLKLEFIPKYYNLKMYRICLPKFTFLIDNKDQSNFIDKTSPIHLELYRISSSSMIFSQASTNTKKSLNLIMQNIRGISSNVFTMNFLWSVLKKYKMYKKCLFFKTLLQNRKVNKIFFRNNRKLFYNYFFIKFNKNNYKKIIKWKKFLI